MITPQTFISTTQCFQRNYVNFSQFTSRFESFGHKSTPFNFWAYTYRKLKLVRKGVGVIMQLPLFFCLAGLLITWLCYQCCHSIQLYSYHCLTYTCLEILFSPCSLVTEAGREGRAGLLCHFSPSWWNSCTGTWDRNLTPRPAIHHCYLAG